MLIHIEVAVDAAAAVTDRNNRHKIIENEQCDRTHAHYIQNDLPDMVSIFNCCQFYRLLKYTAITKIKPF